MLKGFAGHDVVKSHCRLMAPNGQKTQKNISIRILSARHKHPCRVHEEKWEIEARCAAANPTNDKTNFIEFKNIESRFNVDDN